MNRTTLCLATLAIVAACSRRRLPAQSGALGLRGDAWPANPIAVLIEHDPWAMVVGADCPRVEVFADGTVLRLNAASKEEPAFVVGQLTPEELSAARRALTPSKSFWQLKDRYAIDPGITDLKTTELIVSDGPQTKRIEVYGYTPENRKQDADELPAEFDRLCKVLLQLRPHTMVPWRPRYLEVMLWPYEHSPESPLPWPDGWPTLNDPLVFRTNDSYSIILPGDRLEQLRALIHQRRENRQSASAAESSRLHIVR